MPYEVRYPDAPAHVAQVHQSLPSTNYEVPALDPIRRAYPVVTVGGRRQFARGGRHSLINDVLTAPDRTQDTYARQLAAARVDGFLAETFADVEIADVPGSGASVRRPDLWVPRADYPTPLWDALMAGPTGPQRFSFPRFASASGLAGTAVEKTEPAGGTVVDELVEVTPDLIWGKVEVTRQVLQGGDEAHASTAIVTEMIRSLYEAREAAAATFLNTLTAATDITLTGTPAATPDNDDDQLTVDDLEVALADLLFARGGAAMTELLAHQALYRVLARVKDDQGRRLYPQLLASAGRPYPAIAVGGRVAVPAYALGTPGTASTNSWLFARGAVRGWAGPVQRLQWNFGSSVQSGNLPQLSFVTLGVEQDVAFALADLTSVRQITFDPSV